MKWKFEIKDYKSLTEPKILISLKRVSVTLWKYERKNPKVDKFRINCSRKEDFECIKMGALTSPELESEAHWLQRTTIKACWVPNRTAFYSRRGGISVLPPAVNPSSRGLTHRIPPQTTLLCWRNRISATQLCSDASFFFLCGSLSLSLNNMSLQTSLSI